MRSMYHYLPNEVFQFLEMIESVARLRDVRVFLLGNATSSVNPYFSFLNIGLPYGSDIKTFKDGLILVNYVRNMEYREAKRKTKFGRIIEGTSYADYAIDNQFMFENNAFIGKRPDTAKFYFTLKINSTLYGIWVEWNENQVYISKHYDPKCPIIYAINKDEHDGTTKLVSVNHSDFFRNLILHYRSGLLLFENQQIKQNVLPVILKYVN